MDHRMPLPPRAFEPWRYAKTPRARQLIDDVVAEMRAYAGLERPRIRAMKARDFATFALTIESVLCDLIHLHLSASANTPTRVTITRSKEVLSHKAKRYRAPCLNGQLRNILCSLHAARFLEQVIGDRSQFALVFTDELGKMRERRRTTIEPGSRLIHAIEQYGITFDDLGLRESEVLVLRGERLDYWHIPAEVDYVETEETERLRGEVRQINRWLGRADLALAEYTPGELKHVDVSDRELRRVFTRESFTSGGRLAGSFWMPLPRLLRLSRLRINGERVASVDYSSFNPRVLYAKEGVEPAQEDLYTIPGYERWRVGMKRLLNARLFDEGPRKSKPKRTPEEIRAGAELFPPDVSIEELLTALEAAHGPIAQHFGTGIGHRLQFLESAILVQVLLRLMGEGIVALPVHDCVVVGRSHAEMARHVMEIVSCQVMGRVIKASVEAVCDGRD